MKKFELKNVKEGLLKSAIVKGALLKLGTVKDTLIKFAIASRIWWQAQSKVTQKVFVVLVLLLFVTSVFSVKSLFSRSRSVASHVADKHDNEHAHEDSEDEHGHEDSEGEHEEEGDEHNEGESAVKLTQEQMTESGIEVAKAAAGIIRQYVELPAEVVLNSDKATHVNPRYPGIAKAVYKYLGDHVKAGESLAVIESNVGLQQYTLKSSIGGVVIKRDVNVGEYVSESAEVFAIADLSTVWVNMTVYQKDLDRIKKGLEVVITADNDTPPATGSIFFAAPIVDEKTRTALAAVKLNNPNLQWKPGQFVTGKVIVGQSEAPVVVTKLAVQTVEDKPSIFVKTEKGFETRHLRLGREDAENYEVLEGLKVDEEYVSKNSFLLKAEIAKGEAEHDH